MALNDLPMRQERIFDADGVYNRVVDGNVLMHREAIATGTPILTAWLSQQPQTRVLRVLDLACGGKPMIIAAWMAAFPQWRFVYTGIDLNVDQLARVRTTFVFSPNVTARIVEGDAWALDTLPDDASVDLVFIGLNTHHATPEEVAFAARHIARVLAPNGLFFNHDLFRPLRFEFFRRPTVSPTAPEKHVRLIPPEKLRGITIPLAESTEDWRTEFLQRDADCLRSCGIAETDVQATMEHMRERDYPISTTEMVSILTSVGLTASVHAYLNSTHRLREYLALVVANKP
ncbi:MAG: class I SAM-dependent methyltransferase [Deltaproteobacteria bacterium]|nr:class I SAM-dependent methyltransferase [Deltaproteobacteria bacterium]